MFTANLTYLRHSCNVFQAFLKISLPVATFLSISAGLKMEAQAAGGPTLTAAPEIAVPDGVPITGGFTWHSQVLFDGSGWQPGEEITIHLLGPLDWSGVTPVDRTLPNQFLHAPTFKANGNGGLTAIAIIPYDGGNTGNQGANMPSIPRPGRYELYGQGSSSSSSHVSAGRFNLHPSTLPFALDPSWAVSRGARSGWLGDQSPEMLDPEWVSTWDERPVSIYATVTASDSDGAHQPMLISHHEIPSTHYGHDFNLKLVPDEEYRWVLGTANFVGEQGETDVGRIELEWEVQNSGRPYYGSYHTGNIGMPLWVMATVGDRVFTVGRWPMDNGHPEEGLRTEIHPPRLLATMRTNHTVVPFSPDACVTRASQVDIFVSGHGGGINVFPDGLSQALDNNGLGGGRIQDVMSDEDKALYYAFGPADSTLIDVIAYFVGPPDVDIKTVAGPSAFGWGLGPEERPINDMDYDFDVPLPAPPPGAQAIQVQKTTHPEHSTAVNEVITYINPDPNTGLPTKAHIHLPYNGADNGVYGRTLKFYWDVYNPPGRHFVVTMNKVTFFMPESFSGKAYLWGDVGGQWFSFTDMDPERFLDAKATLGTSGLEAARFDVYVDPTDKVRVYTYGYDQQGFDALFGVDVGIPAYAEAIHLLQAALAGALGDPLNPNSGDSEKLGGVFWEGAPVPLLPAAGGILGRHARDSSPFYHALEFTVSYVPDPRIRVSGVPANFGNVCVGSTAETTIRISNAAVGLNNNDPYANSGVDTLHATLSLSGTGLSLDPSTPTPLVIDAGQFVDVKVRFTPTSPGQTPGTITIQSDDVCHPSLTYSFCGESVSTGLRVLAVRSDGTPYPSLDQLTITGDSSIKPAVNLKNLPLVTKPNGDCAQVQYHYQTALAPTADAKPGSYYSVRARVGTSDQTIKITLAPCEFQDLVITIPDKK